LLLPLNRPNASSSSCSSTSAGATGWAKVSASGVAVIGRGLAALLHVGFRFQHQQVAPVDVVARARQVGRHLLIGFNRPVQ
jgi:hypothetical protein